MANSSSIEWTESTWNPVTGCTKVSPGCKHCYAERMARRLKAMGQPNYAHGFELTLHEHVLRTARMRCAGSPVGQRHVEFGQLRRQRQFAAPFLVTEAGQIVSDHPSTRMSLHRQLGASGPVQRTFRSTGAATNGPPPRHTFQVADEKRHLGLRRNRALRTLRFSVAVTQSLDGCASSIGEQRGGSTANAQITCAGRAPRPGSCRWSRCSGHGARAGFGPGRHRLGHQR